MRGYFGQLLYEYTNSLYTFFLQGIHPRHSKVPSKTPGITQRINENTYREETNEKFLQLWSAGILALLHQKPVRTSLEGSYVVLIWKARLR